MAKRKINLIITILIVTTLCLVVFSTTYAWYLFSRESSVVNNTAGGGKLEVIYQNGQDIIGKLKPSKTNEGALSTTATIRKSSTSVDGLATITLNIESISSELAISAFKWEVYKNTETQPINSGTLNGVSSGSKIKLVDNYLLTDSNTNFTIKLWLNGDETDGSVANKSISAYIDASAINAPASVN